MPGQGNGVAPGVGGGRGEALTADRLDRMLAILAVDRERAGEVYEKLRLRLLRFFEWHACEVAEDLVDRTIDRVSRKIEDGEKIQASDPAVYFAGVARNILREHRTRRQREAAALRQQPAATVSAWTGWGPGAMDTEHRLRCLERCLSGLLGGDRDMILAYYEGPGGERIASRRKLAFRLGIPMNALRIRCHRLRLELEACVRGCLGGRADSK